MNSHLNAIVATQVLNDLLRDAERARQARTARRPRAPRTRRAESPAQQGATE